MRDITLGQYINTSSFLHRLDPRLKLILSVGFIVCLFFLKDLYAMLLAAVFILVLYAIVKIPYRLLLKSFKPILPIVLFTSLLNMFFVKGETLASIGPITISKQGVLFAAMLSLRILILIASSSLLTYTTTPIQLTNALESIFKPLAIIHFPVHELAMMMTIALRFIPTLIDETDKIINAQKSRGSDLDSGHFLQRIKALTPILIPLFVSAFHRADELALAMECRCYSTTVQRTKLHELKFTRSDTLALFVFVLSMAAILVCNHFSLFVWKGTP